MTTPSELQRTPLHDLHVALGARMVPFAGWDMPVQYKLILEEHRAVRQAAGIFDVSHMGRVEFTGADAAAFLQRMFTGDIARSKPGLSRYTLLCNPAGGIIDDTIIYGRDSDAYFLVCNAGNRPAVLDWLAANKRPGERVEWDDRSAATAMIALQGPKAHEHLAALGAADVAASLPRFSWAQADVAGHSTFIARTGYTGEDGFELIATNAAGRDLWQRLVEGGAAPAGLGARDTLRLEAALPLHGNDITTATNPVEAGLGWAVAWDKGDFVGSDVLKRVRAEGPARRLAGFEVAGRGIPRSHQPILSDGAAVGEVTSGTFSPTLQKGIGMGYVPAALSKVGTAVTIDVRGTMAEAQVVARPFYKPAG